MGVVESTVAALPDDDLKTSDGEQEDSLRAEDSSPTFGPVVDPVVDIGLPSWADDGSTAEPNSSVLPLEASIAPASSTFRRRRHLSATVKHHSHKTPNGIDEEPLSLEFNFNVHCYKRRLVKKWNAAFMFAGDLSCTERLAINSFDPFPIIKCQYFSYPALKAEDVQVFAATSKEAEQMQGRVIVFGTDSHSDAFEVAVHFMTWKPLRNESAIAIRVVRHVEQEVHVMLDFKIPPPTTTTTTTTTTPKATTKRPTVTSLKATNIKKTVIKKGDELKKQEERIGSLDAEKSVKPDQGSGGEPVAGKTVVGSADWIAPAVAGGVLAVAFAAIGVGYFVVSRRRAEFQVNENADQDAAAV